MTKVYPICIARGKNFLPSTVSLPGSLHFKNRNDPGEIGLKGRYVGKPSPDGSCHIALVENDPQPTERWLADLESLVPRLRLANAEDISLFVVLEYDDQCNWEMSSNVVGRLALLNIPILLSAAQEGE